MQNNVVGFTYERKVFVEEKEHYFAELSSVRHAFGRLYMDRDGIGFVIKDESGNEQQYGFTESVMDQNNRIDYWAFSPVGVKNEAFNATKVIIFNDGN